MNNIKKYRTIIVVSVSALIGLISWKHLNSSFSKKITPEVVMKLSISVATPHKATVKSYIKTVGQCTPFNRVVLVPQVEGTLQTVEMPNGGKVTAGQTLFTLDHRSFEAYVKQSEAQLAMDTARYNLNLSQLNRSKDLRSNNFLSQQEYDSYVANVEVSKAQLLADEAVCTLKKIDLEHCFIKAPFDGILSKSSVDAQSFVTRGTPLAVLNQLQPIFADAYLSEQDLMPLLLAQNDANETIEIEAQLIDDENVVQQGQLVSIGNEVEKTSGTFDLRTMFDNQDLQFWPGRGVDLKIYYKTLKDVILVPDSSIHQGNKGDFVYIINGQGLAEMRYINVGQSYQGWSVVKKGLQGDEQVIAEGHALLAPGVPVQPVNTVVAPAF